jgi:hypothetical protein
MYLARYASHRTSGCAHQRRRVKGAARRADVFDEPSGVTIKPLSALLTEERCRCYRSRWCTWKHWGLSPLRC